MNCVPKTSSTVLDSCVYVNALINVLTVLLGDEDNNITLLIIY